MVNTYTEHSYPINFREEDAKILGEHLKHRHLVELIGINRVGISNFLRFYLNNDSIIKTYINDQNSHLFIPVDLNDLVEIKTYPFWILIFKRVVDCVDKIPNSTKTKKKIQTLFLNSIQSKDLFLTFDNLRAALSEISRLNIMPTIFLIRFDRLKKIFSDELFANLQSFIDATGQRLSYVFTSSRPLAQISSKINPKKSLVSISETQYIKPAGVFDMRIIFDNFEKRYNIKPSEDILERLIKLSGGHVQYLHLLLININEKIRMGDEDLTQYLKEPIFKEERITLQSEEIYQSLTASEQEILKKITGGKKLDLEEGKKGEYLWDTGMITNSSTIHIFSPLFEYFLKSKHKTFKSNATIDMTNKENLLFEFLENNLNQLCERDKIATEVWPEYEELGISDWTIDRLISRLREKLKIQKSPFSITTVKTRGYKLVRLT